jgi:hypothetical protein
VSSAKPRPAGKWLIYLVSGDFFIVPTARLRDLFVFVVLAHHRRGVLPFNVTKPHSPWQNSFAERLIGSIRRECLDHVLVLGERHLRRTLSRYFAYYRRTRTHLSLDRMPRAAGQLSGPKRGRVISIREVSGLHHRYVRRAA